MLSDNFVRNRSASHWNARHVATRTVNRLANGFRYFVCLSCCEADFPLTVADCNESVERKATASLHDFRDAIDCNHVLDKLASAFASSITTLAVATFSIA